MKTIPSKTLAQKCRSNSVCFQSPFSQVERLLSSSTIHNFTSNGAKRDATGFEGPRVVIIKLCFRVCTDHLVPSHSWDKQAAKKVDWWYLLDYVTDGHTLICIHDSEDRCNSWAGAFSVLVPWKYQDRYWVSMQWRGVIESWWLGCVIGKKCNRPQGPKTHIHVRGFHVTCRVQHINRTDHWPIPSPNFVTKSLLLRATDIQCRHPIRIHNENISICVVYVERQYRRIKTCIHGFLRYHHCIRNENLRGTYRLGRSIFSMDLNQIARGSRTACGCTRITQYVSSLTLANFFFSCSLFLIHTYVRNVERSGQEAPPVISSRLCSRNVSDRPVRKR